MMHSFDHRLRVRVVSNFGDGGCGAREIHTRARKGDAPIAHFRRSPRVASPRNFARSRVYFARPTIAIAKIRDYWQSKSIKSLFASRLACLCSACCYCYFSNAPSIYVFCPFFPFSLGPL